jgi:hypothetical protein
MSLKIERDTIRQNVAEVAGPVVGPVRGGQQWPDGPIPGTSGKHPYAEKLGTALTGGKANAGTKGYLMVRAKESRIFDPTWIPMANIGW